MEDLFSKSIGIDENRFVSVNELPDGSVKFEALTIRENMITERYQGSRMIITKEAANALRILLNDWVKI